MQSLRVHAPGGLAVEETADPVVPEDGVLVAVAYGGICGSDLHYARHGRNGDFVVVDPLILGHEISGTVRAVGPRAQAAPPVGTRVVVHPATPSPPPGASSAPGLNRFPGGSYLGSASTRPHVQGGFAELVPARVDQLRVLPEHLPLRRAALAEPLAVALHAVSLAGPLGDRRIHVSGAGPIGLLAVLALRARGARGTISASDLSPQALELARLVGADETSLIGRDEPLAEGSVELVIEASGAPPAATESLRLVAPGGTVVQLGILPSGELTLPYSSIIAREATVRGAWRFDVELDEAVAVLAERPEAEHVITHEFPLAEGLEAFAVAGDSTASSKVLLAVG